MPKRNKTRRLWLNVKYKFSTKRKPAKWKIKEVLLRSLEGAIDDEKDQYQLPDTWDVILEWRNKEDAPMRSGPWQEELENSAQSSVGFDMAVMQWLQEWDVPPPRKRGKRDAMVLVHSKGKRVNDRHRPRGKKRAAKKANKRGAKTRRRNKRKGPGR